MTRTETVHKNKCHPELVSGSFGGTRVQGKRFRTKFGMTRTDEVGMDRPQEPHSPVILNLFQDLLEEPRVKTKTSELNSE